MAQVIEYTQRGDDRLPDTGGKEIWQVFTSGADRAKNLPDFSGSAKIAGVQAKKPIETGSLEVIRYLTKAVANAPLILDKLRFCRVGLDLFAQVADIQP